MNDVDTQNKIILQGEIPSPSNPPTGCTFHPRCYMKDSEESCNLYAPEKRKVGENHFVWCNGCGVEDLNETIENTFNQEN